jgi:hypothetical protein
MAMFEDPGSVKHLSVGICESPKLPTKLFHSERSRGGA